MHDYRVLVIGGYGFFGSRLVERLARQPGLHIMVAGRSELQAQSLVRKLSAASASQLSSVALDAMSDAFARQLKELSPQAVVHASGPFQGQDYRVAQACIAAGAHYIDLADGRAFVSGITALDVAAVQAGVCAISGASSVPALSSAVADYLVQGMTQVHTIDIGISPGNRTERGLSTMQAILSYCGKPLPGNGAAPVFGWHTSRRHTYPAPVGTRLLSPCDVPDLALLPGRYAGMPTVQFGAGLELGFLHRGMNLMALAARIGLVRDWSAHAGWLKRAADWFKTWGSDAGAMHVSATGLGAAGKPVSRAWHLLATQGHGPYVPTLAAAALLRKLKSGNGNALPAGARPCIGLLALEDFAREAQGLQIQMREVGA